MFLFHFRDFPTFTSTQIYILIMTCLIKYLLTTVWHIVPTKYKNPFTQIGGDLVSSQQFYPFVSLANH